MNSHDDERIPKGRKEIYTYTAPWTVYSMSWSKRGDGLSKFRMAIGSFREEYSNEVKLIQLVPRDTSSSLKLTNWYYMLYVMSWVKISYNCLVFMSHRWNNTPTLVSRLLLMREPTISPFQFVKPCHNRRLPPSWWGFMRCPPVHSSESPKHVLLNKINVSVCMLSITKFCLMFDVMSCKLPSILWIPTLS